MTRHPFLTTGARVAERVVGRRRLAQTARLLTDFARLDVANDIEFNGEQGVQRLALTETDTVIFDVGAHFGEWSSSLLANTTGPVTLHSFEASAATRARAAAALGECAQVHHLGLSDRSGTAEFLIALPEGGINSLVPSRDPARSARFTETIRLSTVDEQMERFALDRLTLLKTDVEGHDLSVIRGASRGLAEQRIGLVQFEYNARWIDSRTFLADAFDLMQEHGYELGKVTPRGVEHYPRWHPELERFVESNYLAWSPAWNERVPTFAWWGP